MSVDVSNASSAPLPVPKATTSTARARAATDGAHNADGGASFLSMLSALGASGLEPTLEPAKSLPPGDMCRVNALETEGLLTSGQTSVDARPFVDAAKAMSQAAECKAEDPAGMAALSVDPANFQPTPDAVPLYLMPMYLNANAVPLHAGMLPRSAANAARHTAADPALETEPANPFAEPLGPVPGTPVATKPDTFAFDAGFRFASQAAIAAGASDVNGEAGIPADRFTAVADPDASAQRIVAATQAGLAAPPMASLFEAGATGMRAGPGARNAERSPARQNALMAGAGFVAWHDAMPTGTSHGASPVYAPGAATPVPAAAVAQKMHYWVSRGVQSAELQLEAFGGGSVDVRIAVKGDEAFVEFRSDQPAARKLLQDAMPQLKELLAGEGLMLSGGFVGSSAQQQTWGRDQPGHLPVARPAGARVAVATISAAVPARTVPGAAVDLFV